MNPQRKTEPFEGEKWFSKHSKKEEDIKTVNREKEIVIKFHCLTGEKMSRGFTRRERNGSFLGEAETGSGSERERERERRN